MSDWAKNVAAAFMVTASLGANNVDAADNTRQIQENTKSFIKTQIPLVRKDLKNRGSGQVELRKHQGDNIIFGDGPETKITFIASAHRRGEKEKISMNVDCDQQFRLVGNYTQLKALYNTAGTYSNMHRAIIGHFGSKYESSRALKNANETRGMFWVDRRDRKGEFIGDSFPKKDLQGFHRVSEDDLFKPQKVCEDIAREHGIFKEPN